MQSWKPVLSLALLCVSAVANAEVSVEVGSNTIPRADAIGAKDLTIRNEYFAIGIAVDSAPPWGVARGGILDISLVRNGELDYDIASLVDFIPNIWSSWPTTYQRVTVEKSDSSEALVKTVRDWGDVELESTFHVRAGDTKIHLTTRMTNRGDTSLDGIHSGYVVWPDGGSLFGIPGLPSVSVVSEENAFSDWSAAYDENWVLGMHAPYSEVLAYNGRDRYLKHDLAPGETQVFEAWLQIENDGTLAPIVQADIDFTGVEYGRLSGQVSRNDGEAVERPAVIVMREGSVYAWTIGTDGSYGINLPVGDYGVYATARGHAQGATENVTVVRGRNLKIDFDDVRAPGAIHIAVTEKESNRPMDARITIREGDKSVVGYFGKNTFFTALDTIGETTETIAPGKYTFEISAGGGFISVPAVVELLVEPGKTHMLTAEIPVLAEPQQDGWYSADLHHHSDVLDGFTEAEFVMRSELAAGVDITFLSDHDSVLNNEEMQALSSKRGMHFIAGTEMSPSWAHFNAFPLDEGKTVDIDTGQATVQEIFAAARSMGADVVELNHPYSEYGYFTSADAGVVPGGHDDDFDLVEIEAHDAERNNKTLKRTWQLWNDGKRAYLAAGSDAHDVWLETSGAARTYAYVEGDLTIEKFVHGLKAGHSYASQGPLVTPEIVFGQDIEHIANEPLALSYVIQAVSGLRSAQLIERGEVVKSVEFDGEVESTSVDFSVDPSDDTWYSLVVEDKNNRFAYTNPVWVTVAN